MINTFLLGLVFLCVRVTYAQLNEAMIFNESTTGELGLVSSNTSLVICLRSQFPGLLQRLGPVLSNLTNPPDVNRIFSVLDGDFFAEFCRNLNGFDACLRDTPVGEDDRIIQKYIDYNNLVRTLRNFLCRNSNDVATIYRCIQQMYPTFILCGGIHSSAIKGQITPAALCPLMDSIVNCTTLQIRSCDQKYANDFSSLRNVYSDSCRASAEHTTLLTPAASKLVQCSLSLFPDVFQALNISLTNVLSQRSSYSNIDIGSLDRIFGAICRGLDQFFGCAAREASTSRHYIDIIVREIIDITNPTRLQKAFNPVCDFGRRHATELATLGTCNVAACVKPLVETFRNLSFGVGIPGRSYRDALCGPIETFVKCESAILQECNENIGSLVDDFASGILRGDCGGRLSGPGNSSQRYIGSAVLILMFTILSIFIY